MNITRRLAVKHILVLSGSVSLLPSCFHDDDKATLPLKNISLSRSNEKLLGDIEETIIPATDTPGAKDLSLHLFTLKMIDDCYEKDKQQQFVNGLKEINSFSKKKYGNNFSDCTLQQREDLLMTIESKKDVSKNLSDFYSITKDLTIKGFMTSKYVMTKLVKYEMVPGRFHGSYPITKKDISI